VSQTKLVYYQEDDGTVPIADWLARLPEKARAKCAVYLMRLEREGHELRRPIADYLRDGIYELRPTLDGVQYRILYFFHGREAVVASHGLSKEQKVPSAEIERAVRRMDLYKADPQHHTSFPARRS
jgi:phage-related protein